MKNPPLRALANIFLSYGFVMILVLVVIGFSMTSKHFLSVSNMMGLLHATVPLAILASGLAMVVLTGKLDVSVGSIAFLSTAIGGSLLVRLNFPPVVAFSIMAVIGMLCGLINGFIVVVLRVNPLITTMGTMFAFRGIALYFAQARVISIPEHLRDLGNFRIGPLYVDIVVAALFLMFFHFLYTRTVYGRFVKAIGNDSHTASRVGVPVERITMITFIVSGLAAGIGGMFTMLQLGGVTLHMGVGMEFTAIAAIVIGGISLFGGRGSILPGFLLGVLTLAVIENGLNHTGASPYLYPFVRGGIILLAMYMDSLKNR